MRRLDVAYKSGTTYSRNSSTNNLKNNHCSSKLTRVIFEVKFLVLKSTVLDASVCVFAIITLDTLTVMINNYTRCTVVV